MATRKNILPNRRTTTGSLQALVSPSLRASERVSQYLLKEFARTDLKDGARLPPMRSLAGHLHVSLRTVHAVILKLTKEGRIQTRGGSGTFLVSRADENSAVLRLAVSVPLTKKQAGGEWAYRIAAGIFHAASRVETPIYLMPIAPQIEGTDAARKKLLALRSEVDGLILFSYSLYPFSVRDEVTDFYEKGSKPVVFVDQPALTVTANFVSLDYYGAGNLLGQVWQKAGRRSIALITEAPLKQSVLMQAFRSGLQDGLGTGRAKTIPLRVFEIGERTEEEGHRVTSQILRQNGGHPDAIFCATDQMALGALRSLGEHGIRVPADVSVVAGVGLDVAASPFPQLTRLNHPLESIGEELVAMLLKRIELKGGAVPGRLLTASFIQGTTTRSEENALLGIGLSPAMDAAASRPGVGPDGRRPQPVEKK